MIELVSVSKYYPTDFGRHYIFRDVSLALPIDKSVGVLGPNGAGKSTFLRLIGGADIPSEGKILRSGRISPPMGLTPGLQSSLTGGENARFAGRIYGLQRDEIGDLIEYVRELANIGKYFDMPVGTYSAGMRQRVAFAINMSMNFDYYLFDEISAAGDKEFRKSAAAMVKERLKTSKFIIASHRTDELLDICDSGIVIQNGNLTFYDDIKDALAAYGGEDEVQDRRAKRTRRRADKIDGIANPEADAAAAAAGDTGSERKAFREQRRAKRELKIQQTSPVEPSAAEPEAPVAEAGPVETDDDRKALREQRRLRRELKIQQAAPVEPAAAEPETPVADVEPDETDEDRKALREQRRLRRELRQRQTMPVETIAGEPEPADAEAAAQPSTEPDGRKARREQRRLKREMKMAADAFEAVPEPVPEMPEVLPELAPVSPPVGPTTAPPVGTAPLAQRVRPRPALDPVAPAREPQAGTAPLPPVTSPALRPAGSRSLLIQRATLRQDRAQMTAARAARLLLQFLDDQAGSGPAASQARAWLVASAQETAAMDAAQAREMRDSIDAAEFADAAPPASVSPASFLNTGGSFLTGQTRSVFGRATPSPTNPD